MSAESRRQSRHNPPKHANILNSPKQFHTSIPKHPEKGFWCTAYHGFVLLVLVMFCNQHFNVMFKQRDMPDNQSP